METIMTFNEIISPVPRVLIFISHSHFLLNLTKGYLVCQEKTVAFSCSEITGVEPRKWERCRQAKEFCTNYTAVIKISWKLILFVFCSVFLSSRAPAVIKPGTFSFLSCVFSIQAQGHAAELQVNQAVVSVQKVSCFSVHECTGIIIWMNLQAIQYHGWVFW